jgi:hypothetical protein
MLKAIVAVICILTPLSNVVLHSHASDEMQDERPESPIDVITDKTDYYTGDTVKIKGSVPALENGHEVNVIVKDANGETFTKLRIKPTDDSKFETSFQIPSYDKLFPTGKWKINIGYAIWAAKLEINVLAGESKMAYSVTISKPELITNSMQETRPGDEVMIVSEIQNNEERVQQVFYIVKIEDTFGTTVFLDSLTVMLRPKQTTELSVTWVPELAGEYTLEIFVWNDMSTPTPLAPSQSISKTIAHK